MGEAAKPLLVEGFQADCHVVLPGRSGNLFDNVSKVVLCGRRNTVVSVSQDELQFFVAGAANILEISIVILCGNKHFRPVASHALHSTLYTPHSTFHT